MVRFTRWLGRCAAGAALLGGWLALPGAAPAQQAGPPRPALGAPVPSADPVLPPAAALGSPVPARPGAAPQTGEKKDGEKKDGEKKDGEKKEDDKNKSAWYTHPKYQIYPRPAGFFAILPTGPGYYSLGDVLTGTERQNPPPGGYPRFAITPFPFFDADFRYVDDPKKGKDADFFERLHRVHLGDNWLFATGGEFRYRLFNEVNSRLSGKDNRYDLTRLRLFSDLWYQDQFRLYVEFISAQSFNQDLNPLLIDRDYADILNLFFDLKVLQGADGNPWYVRGGRQQMLLGSQRLVSPLDWANTMRTFDGVRLFKHSAKLDVDFFWLEPVIPNAQRFNSGDHRQQFAGAFTEYRPNKNRSLDLYYFFLDNANPPFNFQTKTPVNVGPLALSPYNVHTLGYRYAGSLDNYKNVLFDSENMLQLGRRQDQTIVAGSSATGLGYHFAQAPWNPTVWAYFDWASGSNNLNGGQFSTFNQLFPFGHYYFGWLDLVGRQNIQDWNFHAYLYPTKWITLNTQYHIFRLDSATDALYNAGGAVLRFDPTGQAGRNVGQELDVIANFHLTRHQDILAAYGHLWEGRFLRQTGPGSTAETFWLMYNVRW